MPLFKNKNFSNQDISPDEIFLDAKNDPGFNREGFEGFIEKAISRRTSFAMAAVFILILCAMLGRVGLLQIARGESFQERSEKNHLRLLPLTPERGVIYDRYGKKLAWNELDAGELMRKYINLPGLSHILGYVGYPSGHESSDSLSDNIKYGKAGVERAYDEYLRGKRGARLVEVDSRGDIVSESIQQIPENGSNVFLSVDAEMQSKLFNIIEQVIKDRGFVAGAGVILDTKTGEVLAATSWPEFDSTDMSSGDSKKFNTWITSPDKPFFFRAISGLYSPGSIFKPIVALAALQEGVIDPLKQIFSSGSIKIPNPYDPTKFSIFYDWKAHGWVDMRRAIEVSSNVYFYTIGGGFDDVGGLGASRIKQYAEMFGLNKKTGIDLGEEATGFIPDPDWKAATQDDIWRVGDTYNLSIGQGWVQVTPLQMAMVASRLANNGTVIKSHVVTRVVNPTGDVEYSFSDLTPDPININQENFQVVKEGMRMAARQGTAKAVSGLGVEIAGKTGTAELGVGKQYVNSWFIGFLPYDDPKIAMSIVLEKGSVSNLVGAPYAARQILSWMMANRYDEYIR